MPVSQQQVSPMAPGWPQPEEIKILEAGAE